MKNKSYKRDINKEIMFSKIMPSYNAEEDNDYNDDDNAQSSRYMNNNQDINGTGQINQNMIKSQQDPNQMGNINNFNNNPYVNPASVQNTNIPMNNNNNPNNFTGYNNIQDQNQAAFSGSASISPNGFINANIPISPVVTNNVQAAVSPNSVNGIPGQNAVTSQAHNDDEEKLINIIEYIVQKKLETTLTTFKCCKCDECRKAVTLKILNQITPEYVYMRPSQMKELISEDNYKNLNQPIIRSVLEIKANPPHQV